MTIVELIIKGLKDRNKKISACHKLKNHFSPTDSDKCPRQLYYEFKHFPKIKYTDIELSTFAIGQVTHDFLESIIKNQVKAEFRIDTIWRDIHITGYVDSIILTDEGLAVVDYKTIKHSATSYLTKTAKISHIKQVLLYMDILNINIGYIVYWDKSNGDMKEYKIYKKDYKKLLDEIEYLFKNVKNHLNQNTLPNNEYNPNEWKCNFCKYKEYCQKNINEVNI